MTGQGDTAWAGALVEAHGIGVTRGGRRVLDAVDLTVEPGRWVAVVGPNRSGSSTLLRALAGLIKHDGRALVDGADVATLSAKDRARLVGYAPQAPLLPDGVTVRDYVQLGRSWQRAPLGRARKDGRGVVDEAIARLGLRDVAGRPLRAVSEGERRLAVLARALAQQARLLLLDEPTSALDLGQAQRVLELVDDLRSRDGLTVVTALGDLTLAGQYADVVLLLARGRAVACGPPSAVITTEVVAEHFGVTAQVTRGPQGLRVHPVRSR